MEKQILYGSEYGTTKAYAEKCAELTGIPAKGYEEADSLEGCDLLIYFGGLYAGGVKGLKATLKKVGKETNLILVTVGLADVDDEENISHIRQSISKQIPAEILAHTQVFHLRGGIDYSRLNFKHKTMMTLLYSKAKNLPEEKKTADARAMVETFGKQVSFVDFGSLSPILNVIANADLVAETNQQV